MKFEVDSWTLRFTLLIAWIAVLGCDSTNVSKEASSTGVELVEVVKESQVLSQVPENAYSAANAMIAEAISDEDWQQSAYATAWAVKELVSDQRWKEAIVLTQQTLALPRHANRNDSFGWGHATLCFDVLVEGLVDAKRWDDLIEVGLGPHAKLGNEYVESRRLRALALAHWSKHQLTFRSNVLTRELESLRKSLVKRFDMMDHWNQTATPDELIEVDYELKDRSLKHIDSSLLTIADLVELRPSSRSQSRFIKQFLDERMKLPIDNSPKNKGSDCLSDLQKRMAPDFELWDTNDNVHSLMANDGRPTLVVFYLGRKCLHCAMQLKVLSPEVTKFEAAGIRILGVSSDSVEDLNSSLKQYHAPVPFPLLADGEQRVFQQYGLNRPEPDEPLHGTFLVDERGQILWYDVDEDPFMDVDFLLEESKRLLQD